MRQDKHLLPVEKFTDAVTSKEVKMDKDVKLPYPAIDIIFNHKNMWANLQNTNPAKIMYHIHEPTQWLPFINYPYIEHPWTTKKNIMDAGGEIPDEGAAETGGEKKKKKKKGGDERMDSVKYAGSFMEPLTEFYDAKAMGPPLSIKQVERAEKKIYDECVIALKQVRSSRNLNCNIKTNHMTRTILKKYIDYLEDKECLRILDERKAKSNVDKEVRKLTPVNYRVKMLPAFFNSIDSERIGTVIRDQSSTFLLSTGKKVLFSVAVKIYAYNSEVNSVRILLVKMEADPTLEGEGVGDAEDGASTKRSKKSKSRSGKSKSRKSEKDGATGEPQDAPPK